MQADARAETLAAFEEWERGTPVTASEVAEHLPVGRRSTYERLQGLADEGAVNTKKVGARGRVWWRPPERPRADGVETDSLARVLDDAEVGVFVLDEQFDVAWANRATERYFDIDREAVVGRDKRAVVEELIGPVVEDTESFTETVLATDESNTRTEQFECHVTAGEGRESRWLEHRSKPIETGAYSGGRVELYYDVTAWREAERARSATDHQYQTLVDAVEEYAIFRLDAAGRVQSWNDGAAAIKGYAEEEIVGESFETFYPEAARDADVPAENLAAAAAEGYTTDEGWRVRADGTRFWAHVTITALYDEDGAVEGYTKVTRDMTERRERAAAVERERALLERVLETSPVGIAIFDSDGTVRLTNERIDDLAPLELTPGEPVDFGTATGTIRTEDGTRLDPTDNPVTRVVESGETVLGETLAWTSPEGVERWGSVNVAPLTTASGEVGRAVLTIEDVTRLKAQSQRLERRREDLEAELDEVFRRVTDGFFGLDTDHRFTYVNDRAEALLEESGETLLGAPIEEAFDPGPFLDTLETVSATSEPAQSTSYYEPLDAWFEYHVYPSESGVSVYFREVTERKRRERHLEESRNRYRALIENVPNGSVALVDTDLRYTTVGGSPLEATDADAGSLEGRRLTDVLPGAVADELVPRYEAALEGEKTAFEATFGDRTYRVQTVPVRNDDGTVFAAMGMSQEVTERRARERELERQQDRLTALNSLNEVVQEITVAAIEQSTRAEIEAQVCERLAASDSYAFAWTGEVDMASETVELRSEAGVSGYLDDVTLSVDPSDERARGPTARAFRERELQITHDPANDAAYERWSDRGAAYGFQSSAAIPLVHEETVYGVLNVYTERPDAFSEEEQVVIERLGEVIGHAIASAERKQALISDEVVELELQIQDVFEQIGLSVGRTTGTITLDQTVPVDDGDYLVYGSAMGDAMATVETFVDAEALPHWDAVRTLWTDDERTRFELRLSGPPVLTSVAERGGDVREAAIRNGNYYMRIHLAPTTDVQALMAGIGEAYPGMELLSKRRLVREDTTDPGSTGPLLEGLTDRQRASVETAAHAGYFAWPRETTGESVATSLDVKPATFHQHLRAAQQKIFTELFDVPEPGS